MQRGKPGPRRRVDNAMRDVRVGIVGPDQLAREALVLAIAARGTFRAEDLGEGSDLRRALVERDGTTVVLLILVPECAVALLEGAGRPDSQAPVVALAVEPGTPVALDLIELGVSGLLSSSSSIDELFRCIDYVIRGEKYFPARIIEGLLRRRSRSDDGSTPSARAPTLSHRESEIVALLRRSMTNREIARTLGIASSTVKNHVHNILTKLSVHRRAEAPGAEREVSPPVPLHVLPPSTRDARGGGE